MCDRMLHKFLISFLLLFYQ